MWEKINKFVHSQTVIATFLLSAFFMCALTLFFLSTRDITFPYSIAFFTMGQLVLSAAVIWLMRKMQVFDVNDFKFKNMGKGFLLGWFGIVFAMVAFYSAYSQLPEKTFIVPNPLHLSIVVLHPFVGTGILEEVLIRGLILKLLLTKMGHTKKGIINACLISSALFGIVHIVNIIQVGSIWPVISQIIYATAGGFFFAALFLRTKTLMITILLHGIINLSSQIFGAIVPYDIYVLLTQPPSEINIPEIIINTLLISIPLLVVGFVLLRKVKPDETEAVFVECRN